MLKKIIKAKQSEIMTLTVPERSRRHRSISLLEALRNPKRGIGLIAEIKKASPSKGVIRHHFDPVQIALAYEKADADALSVLTDEMFFQGHRDFLTRVKEVVSLPILRKDFIIDRIQIDESLKIGADAILLIGEALPIRKLRELYEEAYEKGLECIVEVHEARTLEMILTDFTPKIIGINNRNLKTFKTSLSTTNTLAKLIPKESFLVSESGIHSIADLQFAMKSGASAVLIGEAFMREEDIEGAVRRLFGERS